MNPITSVSGHSVSTPARNHRAKVASKVLDISDDEVIDISDDEVVNIYDDEVIYISDDEVIDITDDEEPPRKRPRPNYSVISQLKGELKEARRERRSAEERLKEVRRAKRIAEARLEEAMREKRKAEEKLEKTMKGRRDAMETVRNTRVSGLDTNLQSPFDVRNRVFPSTSSGISSNAKFVVTPHGDHTCEFSKIIHTMYR